MLTITLYSNLQSPKTSSMASSFSINSITPNSKYLRGNSNYSFPASAALRGTINFPVKCSSNLSCERSCRFGIVRASSIEEVVVDHEIGDVERKILRVGLICGGPSAERGISLNSARSVLDNIQVQNPILSYVYYERWRVE